MSHQHDADYFDFVIFGATGFTAGFVLEEIVHHNRLPSGFTWAIAGRKEQALQTIKEKYTGISGIPAPGIIVADVQSGQGLLDMTKSAKRMSAMSECRLFPVVEYSNSDHLSFPLKQLCLTALGHIDILASLS